MYKVDLWVWTDSREQASSLKGYAYSIETKLANGKIHRVAVDNSIGAYEGSGMEGTWNKVILVAITEAVGRFKTNAEVIIHSENRWVLNMIKHFLGKWEERGFLKANGEELENVEEWRKIAKASHSLKIEIDPVGYDRSPLLYKRVFADQIPDEV